MTTQPPLDPAHEVLNQPPPLVNYNVFTSDVVLKEALKREGGNYALKQVTEFGKLAGSQEVIDWGFQANENKPVLKTFDRFGNRIDQVEFHPAWHNLMRTSIEHGLHSLPWTEKKPGAFVARSTLYVLLSQFEQGHFCPITMTFASIAALRTQPEIAKVWEPRILSQSYDPEFKPASQKKGVLIGMGMTEKQGGSDVRANVTKATPIKKGGPGEEYLITGHKWFCSVPMSDAFLVLAQAPKGLSCFLLPRWKPDGTRNTFLIQRLKDKLGNRSNASSEVEFNNTWGQLIGEEGRGVPTIIKMVNYTRLDCIIGSTSIIRQALSQAVHHCSYRSAFGKKLIDQPLMKNVLADLSLESEASLVLLMRISRAYDEAEKSEYENHFKRIATAISKYWVCKRASSFIVEAMECLGGNGYVEESILPRLYREAPLNSIWEGSGNVNSLDVLRAYSNEPETVEVLMTEIEKAKNSNPHLDRFIGILKQELTQKKTFDIRARSLVENLVLALQASLLLRFSPSAVSEAFCRSRLSDERGKCFGTLSPEIDFKTLIERAHPQLT